MDNSRFNILEAVRDAYLFVAREWAYLMKAGTLPVVVHIGAALFTRFGRPDASIIESYLWSLPAAALFSWFVFLEMRLLLLGEKIDRLPRERDYLADRQAALKLSIMIALLFNMGMAGLMALLLTLAESGQWGVNAPLTLAGLLIIGALFWGLRFAIAPVLSAVGHPVGVVLRQTWGMMFSLRLLGMGFACLFPVALVFQALLSLLIGRGADPATALKMTLSEQVAVIVATAPMSLLISALLNAAIAYALKQMLGSK